MVFGNCAPTVADSSGFSGALADVGVGQYLVKDGRQLLRLSLPVGKDMVMGKQARSTPSQQAQEAIELVRLRIEETGFTNPAALPNAKVDLEKLVMLLTGPKSDAIFINTAISADKARVYRDTETHDATHTIQPYAIEGQYLLAHLVLFLMILFCYNHDLVGRLSCFRTATP